jgi:hypothetical protein
MNYIEEGEVNLTSRISMTQSHKVLLSWAFSAKNTKILQIFWGRGRKSQLETSGLADPSDLALRYMGREEGVTSVRELGLFLPWAEPLTPQTLQCRSWAYFCHEQNPLLYFWHNSVLEMGLFLPWSEPYTVLLRHVRTGLILPCALRRTLYCTLKTLQHGS